MNILGGYEMKKSQVLDLLHNVSKLARDTGYEDPRLKGLIRSCENSLKTGKINIAVVGEWNNGKSTLINALLGCNLLMSENKECTAAITEVVYSARNYIKVFGTALNNREAPLRYEKNISAIEMSKIIREYTTTGGNNVETEVESVEIGWPYPLLDKNITIIDTPGVNSHSEIRSTLTYSHLPRSHAILMLIDINKAGTTFDLEFIRKIKAKQSDNIFFIINKIDAVREEDLKVGIKAFKESLSPEIKNPHIIALSPLAALYSELIKQSLIDPSKESDYPPTLMTAKGVGLKDPGYGEALFEKSNISSLYEILSQFFTSQYGSGSFYNGPLSFMCGVVAAIIKFCELKIESMQSNSTIDQLDSRISRFEKKIPKYDIDAGRLANSVVETIEKILREYQGSMESVDGHREIYSNIAQKLKMQKINDLIDNKNAKLIVLVQNTVMEYTSKIANDADRKLLELKETIDRRLADIAQDIQIYIETKMHIHGTVFTSETCANKYATATKIDPTPSLAASGVLASATAAGVLGLSGTAIATGATVFGFSTGVGAVLPFLASNPIGWAVGAALITGGIGYMVFRKKPTAESIVVNLREAQIVENSVKEIQGKTEKIFTDLKQKSSQEIEDIIRNLVSKARAQLNADKEDRSIEASAVDRKVGEIKNWIRSAQSLQEQLSAASKSE